MSGYLFPFSVALLPINFIGARWPCSAAASSSPSAISTMALIHITFFAGLAPLSRSATGLAQ
jgi:hypothetical protein